MSKMNTDNPLLLKKSRNRFCREQKNFRLGRCVLDSERLDLTGF
ncbi:MAG: hypothetical protein ACYSTX_04730 [Planctomycetota bacterium]